MRVYVTIGLLFCATLLGVAFGQAATLYQWSFEGPIGVTMLSTTDSFAGVVATKFNDSTLATNATNTIRFGPPNPWYNTNGTSAEFLNPPGVNDPGVGVFLNDSGANSPLDLTTVTNLTIEGFVYPYELRLGDIFSKYGGSGAYEIVSESDGRFAFRLRSAMETPSPIECNDLPYTTNQWYHVAMVWDGTAMRFYVNGVQSQDLGTNHVSAWPFLGPIADSTRSLTIGCIARDNSNPPGNSASFFRGRIDEIRVSDKALSPDEFLLNQTVGSPDHLVFLQQPINALLGQTISPPVTVRILDRAGNPISGTANVTISIGANPGGATLSGTLTVPTSPSSLATFTDLSLDQLGSNYTLAANAQGLGVTTSSRFNVLLPARAWESGLDLHYTNGPNVMPYRLYLPYRYNPATNYPVVIFLHGSGSFGTNNIAQVNQHIAGLIARTYVDYPAILIAPQLSTGFWSPYVINDLTTFIMADVRRNYSVDERRIYLTGLSAGGYGTTEYSRQFPTLFAALAPMSAAEIPPRPPGLLAQVPTWLFHGSADAVVPFSASSNYFLGLTGQTNLTFTRTNYGYPTAISGPIRFTDFVGQGHDIWESIYAGVPTDFYDWMFEQVRPPATFAFTTPVGRSGSLFISGSNSVPFGAGRLFSSTDVSMPLSQWSCVATDWADANGILQFTNNLDTAAGAHFYILKLP